MAYLFIRFLHFFFAFSFVGALVVGEWNARAARRTQSWEQRAMLWEIVRISSMVAGVVGLVLLAVFGNLLAMQLHLSMAGDPWLRLVNGLWLLALIVYLGLCIPASGRLARIARDAAAGGVADAYPRAVARWRVANLLVNLLYLALLALMVTRRSA